jgi:CubicO group peptidase (beta-lactamase class C family)
MANYEFGIPNTLHTRFKIASLSKPVTDAALGVAIDAGKISMDSKVSDFLPGFPRGDAITVRHLVQHRSGIAHTNNLPEYDAAPKMTLAESIAILKTKPLAFEPGSRSSYSNGGFDVLAMMIERATGTHFEAFVQTEVLDRLGMRDTGVAETYKVIPRLAEGYQPGPTFGVRARSRFYPVEIRRSGGALYSTARDMAKFLRASYGGSLISAKSRTEIFGPADRTYSPTGRSPGISAASYIDPTKDIYVVALANNYTPVDSLGLRIYRAATGEPLETEKIATTDRRIAAKEAAFYNGTYVFESFGPTSRFNLAVQTDGRLVAISRFQEPTILVPLSDGRWFYPLFDTICQFQGKDELESMACKSPLKTGGPTYSIVREAPTSG